MADAAAGSFGTTLRIRDGVSTLVTSEFDVLTVMSDKQISEAQGSGTDGLTIWNDMIDAIGDSMNSVVWPPGTFLFTETLTVNQSLQFYAPSMLGDIATVFYWTVDTTGLLLTTKQTTWDGFVFRGASYPDAGAAMLADADSIGVHAQKTFEMRRCLVQYWGGNGIHINSGAGNCNFWKLDKVTIQGVGGDALRAHGFDANAGIATAVDIANVGGACIRDTSLHGNTYIGCSTWAPGNRYGRCSDGVNRYIAGRAIDTTTPPNDTMTSWDDVWYWKEEGGVDAEYGYPEWVEGGPWRYCGSYMVEEDLGYNRSVFSGCYEEQNGSPPLVPPRVAFQGGSNANEEARKEELILKEIDITETPRASAAYGKLYTKSDNKLYFQDGAGTEYTVDITSV